MKEGDGLKARSVFVCSGCGSSTVKWLGRCPECGEFGTMVEESLAPPPGPSAGKAPLRSVHHSPISLSSIEDGEDERHSTGMAELDRVLGGGHGAGFGGADRGRAGHG